MKTILVTGGAGFIGSNLVRHIVSQNLSTVINLDKLTYAGNLGSISDLLGHDKHLFIRGDIADRDLVFNLLEKHKPSAVINLAAETHVDRSIDDPASFVQTNITGTFNLLDVSRSWWNNLSGEERENFRFVHVSSDEVYGPLHSGEPFSEESPFNPRSPYSASKASSDLLVRAYFSTYGFPAMITNSSNNYGPFQFPEKLIPLITIKALFSEKLPVYGDGRNTRDWVYVEDNCRAIISVLDKGRPGDTYNVGGICEKTNIDVVESICDILDELGPNSSGASRRELITLVQDRPGHDRRYAINPAKIINETGWNTEISFKKGLKKTVRWYMDNMEWVRKVTEGKYDMERLGLGEK